MSVKGSYIVQCRYAIIRHMHWLNWVGFRLDLHLLSRKFSRPEPSLIWLWIWDMEPQPSLKHIIEAWAWLGSVNQHKLDINLDRERRGEWSGVVFCIFMALAKLRVGQGWLLDLREKKVGGGGVILRLASHGNLHQKKSRGRGCYCYQLAIRL